MATHLGLGFEALPGGGEDFAVVVGEGVGHGCGIVNGFGLDRMVVEGFDWCRWLYVVQGLG